MWWTGSKIKSDFIYGISFWQKDLCDNSKIQKPNVFWVTWTYAEAGLFTKTHFLFRIWSWAIWPENNKSYFVHSKFDLNRFFFFKVTSIVCKKLFVPCCCFHSYALQETGGLTLLWTTESWENKTSVFPYTNRLKQQIQIDRLIAQPYQDGNIHFHQVKAWQSNRNLLKEPNT